MILNHTLSVAALSAATMSVANTQSPQTVSEFRDACTGKTVVIAPRLKDDTKLKKPRWMAFGKDRQEDPSEESKPEAYEPTPGLDLLTKIKGLDPNAVVTVETEYSAPIDDPKVPGGMTQKKITYREDFEADARGEIAIRKVPSKQLLKGSAGPSVVSASVRWVQKGGSKKSGSSYTSIGLLADDHAFRVVSSPICRWDGPANIVSEYKFNDQLGSYMTIDRTVDLSSSAMDRYGLGVALGANMMAINNRDGMPPFAGAPGPDGSSIPGSGPLEAFKIPGIPAGIWVFGGWWKTQGGRDYTTLNQQWKLKPNDGGFFASRVQFIRYEVVEYTPVVANGCPGWSAKSKGLLDTGIVTTTLYSVPRHLSGNPQSAQDFIEALSPSVDTCSDIYAGDTRFEVKTKDNTPMFYYPTYQRRK
jgi:hypothetical protein